MTIVSNCYDYPGYSQSCSIQATNYNRFNATNHQPSSVSHLFVTILYVAINLWHTRIGKELSLLDSIACYYCCVTSFQGHIWAWTCVLPYVVAALTATRIIPT